MPKQPTHRETQRETQREQNASRSETSPRRSAIPLGLRAIPIPGGVQFDARWAVFPAVFRNIPWVFIIAVMALLFFRGSMPTELFNQAFIIILIVALISPFTLLRYARLKFNEKDLQVNTRPALWPFWKQRRFARRDIREIVCMVQPRATDFTGWELRLQTKTGEHVLLKSPQPAPHLRYIELILQELLTIQTRKDNAL